jgi:hypothetical protein
LKDRTDQGRVLWWTASPAWIVNKGTAGVKEPCLAQDISVRKHRTTLCERGRQKQARDRVVGLSR